MKLDNVSISNLRKVVKLIKLEAPLSCSHGELAGALDDDDALLSQVKEVEQKYDISSLLLCLPVFSF